jgi:hypothetical protein
LKGQAPTTSSTACLRTWRRPRRHESSTHFSIRPSCRIPSALST